MLKIRRIWKCGGYGICFNNILCIFVEAMHRPKLGEVRQLCVVIASYVCWVCRHRSWDLASTPKTHMNPTPHNTPLYMTCTSHNTPLQMTCTSHNTPLYMTCTSQNTPLYMTCTSQNTPLYMTCTSQHTTVHDLYITEHTTVHHTTHHTESQI